MLPRRKVLNSMLYNADTTLGRRLEHTRTRAQAISMASPKVPAHGEFKIPLKQKPLSTIPSYMKHYTTKDLTCLTLLSLVTSNRILLNTAIKVMPYTPTWLVKQLVCPVYSGGENFQEVRKTAEKFLDRGIGNMMLSYAVEDADGKMSGDVLADAVEHIKASITGVFVPHNKRAQSLWENGQVPAAPASGYIALKPTGLMEGSAQILANFDNPEYAEKWQDYLAVCRSICEYADQHGEGKVVIVFDAEKTWLQQGVYAAQREMMKEFNKNNKVVVCGTIQMYLQGSVDFLNQEIALAEKGGYQVAFKLVRGAYIHSEPKRWEVIHKTKEDTDRSYNEGTKIMMDHIVKAWKTNATGPVSRLVVASHNLGSSAIISERMRSEAPSNFDFASDESIVFGQLMGMNEQQSQDLSHEGRKVIKYVPWGPAKETREYLIRRLEENGDAARGGWEDFKSGCHLLALRAVGRA